MTLGESISSNRKRLGLSQIKLAEMLSVSRQSVSKWETDATVPEIDKLIALGEIFGISLDELIKGSCVNLNTQENFVEAKTSTDYQNEKSNESFQGFTARKIVGTILLCFAFLVFIIISILGDIFSGTVFSMPFLLCGVICFLFKRNIGLWCCWAVYFAVDMYLGYGTATNRSNVFYTLSWTREMNYVILAMSWISFLLLLCLWAVTVYRFIRFPGSPRKDAVKALVFFAVSLALRVSGSFLVKAYMRAHHELSVNYGRFREITSIYRFLMFVNEWLSIAAFTALCIYFIRMIVCYAKSKRRKT